MGRLANALIGAAGETLVSVSVEAAEARKAERLAAIREQYSVKDHERAKDLATHQDGLIRGREAMKAPDTLETAGGVMSWDPESQQYSPLIVGGKPAMPYEKPSTTRQYLNPQVEQATDLLKELYKVDTFGMSEEQQAAHRAKIAALESRAGIGGNAAPDASQTATAGAPDRKKQFNTKLGTMLDDIEKGKLSRERAAQLIDGSGSLSEAEKQSAKSALGIGGSSVPAEQGTAPGQPKTPAPDTNKTVEQSKGGLIQPDRSGGRGESLDRVQNIQQSDTYRKQQISEKEQKIEKARKELAELNAKAPDNDADAGRLKTRKSALNKGIAALQQEIKALKSGSN